MMSFEGHLLSKAHHSILMSTIPRIKICLKPFTSKGYEKVNNPPKSMEVGDKKRRTFNLGHHSHKRFQFQTSRIIT